ncbi:fasciclin domain-containing protein [Methanococcoides orientis]|uniref:fasciclin domain-containing protein n=1 Tax=Methanococcoides orientis TaxID=2822137 RepID=UPI001E4223B8|nr:fasciclin domain-containing protein [Methanococcoides orientis]UGV41535.1 fasciclin domain-containing protein [Methanococcoides orientis]
MKINKILVALLLATIVLVSGCTTSEPEEEEMDIVDTAVDAGSFTTLVQAVQAAGLEDTLRGDGPFTVFAPTDEAFAALPEGTLDALLADEEALAAVLTYHVVAGEVMAADVAGLESAETVQGESVTFDTMDGVKVNDANVVQADIMASNGVIHVIDKVILPPSMMEEEEMDIVDTAIEAGSFTTLVQAVQAAGLEETLRSEGPFTVFAPTDEAFAALPEGTLDALLADEEALAGVLTYHVVAGEYMAADVVTMDSAETVQGSEITFTVTDDGVMVNDATVVITDIEASNGVIHVIDAVLIP